MVFRILLGIDVLAAATVVFFFIWGVSDGTVSSFNILLWLALLGGVGGIVGGGLWLNSRGQRRWATKLLLPLAIPTALIFLFFLSMIVLQPDWR